MALTLLPAGTYALLAPLPAVAGSEGVGRVLEVGPGVVALSPGDCIIPADAGLGESGDGPWVHCAWGGVGDAEPPSLQRPLLRAESVCSALIQKSFPFV